MKRLLLVALMVLVTLVGMVGFSRDAESQNEPLTMSEISNAVRALEATVNAGTEYNWTAYYYPNNGAVTEPPATVNAGVPAQRKMYYLTLTSFTAADAIMACDSGFHMASISEIQDPSSVQYAPGRKPTYDSTYKFVPFDQASDQFPDHTGWVRAGDGLSGVVQDQDNCDLWKSSSAQQSGTTMTRRSLWGENNGHSLYEESDPAAWWQSTQTASCSQPEPVWCVEDSERANVNPVTDTIIGHAFKY
jgi:hypothetical protein